MNSKLTFIMTVMTFIATLILSTIGVGSAQATDWRVTPIKLDLNGSERTSVISIVNGDMSKLRVQVRAMEWSQDSAGKDVYTTTGDIVFFPKMISLDKAEERVVRIGLKPAPGMREKTYRLFIEEIPDARKKTDAPGVAIAIRFGVPIFLKPGKEILKGELGKFSISKGKAAVTLKNSGNIHFAINSAKFKGLDAQGAVVFTKEIGGWYLLAGTSRTYPVQIPGEKCKSLSRIEFSSGTTNGASFQDSAILDAGSCLN